jgi:hypothetical protein
MQKRINFSITRFPAAQLFASIPAKILWKHNAAVRIREPRSIRAGAPPALSRRRPGTSNKPRFIRLQR